MSELAGIEIVLFLRSLDLFHHCSAEQILRLASISHERRYPEGTTIFEPGDAAEVLYCVVQGGVRLEGEERGVEEFGPLSTFGVSEILCGRMRSRKAWASSDSLLLAMDAEDFFDLLANNIEIAKALFRRFLPESTPHDEKGAA